jgi:beta-mannosidase
MKIVLILLLLMATDLVAQRNIVLDWSFTNPKTLKNVDAGTHGSVQEKLIAAGELPDPFYGKNENLFAWIEEQTWGFSTTFELMPTDLNMEFIELDFPGIDTYAEIFLNKQLIGFAQNAFRPYHFDVKDKVIAGENRIEVVFYPPVLYHKEAYQKASYHLPAPNDVNPVAIAPYTRKPQFQFGWDWSMRMNTVGFLKPVSVRCYSHPRITNSTVSTLAIADTTAQLKMEIMFEKACPKNAVWKSKLFGDVVMEEGGFKLEREVEITNPKLWWPQGQGEAFLYNDEWEIYTEDNVLIDQKSVRFGVRKSELVMESDQWGTSYVIKVNDRPIFCKGGDYIPQDIFTSRVTDQDLRTMVEQMVKSNFNMVRVWGGGYYPDEAFFNACDELGIMVWQDFMFACAMYPGDPDFLQNVKEEVAYQIPRIAAHPSVVLFNGNNEVDIAWKNWGFQVKYNLYGKDAKEIEESYDRLFKKLLPSSVAEYTSLPYIHTSPLSNWGKDEYYNHGSQHYWGVWHGKDPMSDFAKKIGRFNAEYGFQSFPEYSTLLRFSEKSEWDVMSDVMKHHQKSYVGNGMILKHAKLLYGNPATFEDFVYYSQLTQATAVSMAVTGHRLDAPRCMGTLYWQVNDCWPAPSWSSIDYYGNWKALQHEVRKDYEHIAILRKETAVNQFEYYLLSDQVDTVQTDLTFKIFDLKGHEFESVETNLAVKGVDKQLINFECIREYYPNKNLVVQFEWKNGAGVNKKRTFSELPHSYTKATSSDFKLSIINVDPIKKTATVIIKNKYYARSCWLYSNILGVRFEDNFMDLLPGEHSIEIHYDTLPTIEQLGIKNL